MNFRTITRILFALFLFTTITAAAQTGNGTISGRLMDAATNKPLDFATVSLVNKADSKPVKGMQTDLDGNFKLTGINDGYYLLRISFVGYLTYIKDSIRINDARRALQLGTIRMRASKNSLLKEVVVTSQKSQIQLSTDKKIFSVDQSLVSQGGSATDLLSNVPSVQVDVEGNVNLRGSNNVRVLINGKPSAISGGNVSDILQSIPASSIENIEVITNPSSKYDAEGQSGIINIVLKRNAQVGFNGSASATAGTQSTYNGSLNLNYQHKKFNVYTNYSYRQGKRIGENNFTRTNKISSADDIAYQDQIGSQEFNIKSHNIRTGIDFNIADKTTLSLSNNINLRDIDRMQNSLSNQRNINQALRRQLRQDNAGTGDGNNIDYNLDFSKKYKKPQQELTANIGYSTSHNNNYDSLRTYTQYFSPDSFSPFLQNNDTRSKQRNLNLQLDYTLPLNKDSKLEMGYRSTFNRNDNNYGVDTALNGQINNFIFSPDQSRNFFYDEQVHAAYTNYQQQFGKIGVQIGLRAEEARIRTETETFGLDGFVNNNLKYKQDYFRVYPSVFVSDKLTENQTLQLSYTRRVSRPRDRQISPFLDRSDRQNYQQGNPNLLPEDTHSFELSYINYWKALTLTSSLYYRLTNNNIQQVRTQYEGSNTITLVRFENLNSTSNAGYELIAKLNATQKLDFTGNFNAYYRYLKGDLSKGIRTTSGYSYNGNLTVNYKPVSKLGIQLRGEYQGPQVIAQGSMKAMYGVDGGIRYDITKMLNFSVNSRDIFNTRRFKSETADAEGNFSQFSTRRWSTRVVQFTLAYRFGSNRASAEQKRQRKNQDQPDNGNPDDIGGGAGGGIK
ncbi:outer membrane beta-barrel family protein [Mucilaginibacter lacusdianchii]|uniref:outer membrane beta-barrel family protein n=1 Tax=Mucilaginibacter lacusdianchii TaxID=2684211 RepID=UPI00131CD1A6|nr:outer membrane beta-barrel family protein [Mucilaginibacter sp. JXJ CY 39]